MTRKQHDAKASVNRDAITLICWKLAFAIFASSEHKEDLSTQLDKIKGLERADDFYDASSPINSLADIYSKYFKVNRNACDANGREAVELTVDFRLAAKNVTSPQEAITYIYGLFRKHSCGMPKTVDELCMVMNIGATESGRKNANKVLKEHSENAICFPIITQEPRKNKGGQHKRGGRDDNSPRPRG